jgi:hypothetical protein
MFAPAIGAPTDTVPDNEGGLVETLPLLPPQEIKRETKAVKDNESKILLCFMRVNKLNN